jgi:hypothetical protein
LLEVLSQCGRFQHSGLWPGDYVDIQLLRQMVSVQSKCFANDSLDLVSGYSLPNLFRHGYSEAVSDNLIFAIHKDKCVAVKASPLDRQASVFHGPANTIRLGKSVPFQKKRPFSIERKKDRPTIISKRVSLNIRIRRTGACALWPSDG